MPILGDVAVVQYADVVMEGQLTRVAHVTVLNEEDKNNRDNVTAVSGSVNTQKSVNTPALNTVLDTMPPVVSSLSGILLMW